jgi:hypothetical protein
MIMVRPKTSRVGGEQRPILKNMFRFAVSLAPAAAGALPAAQAQAQAQAQALPGGKRG